MTDEEADAAYKGKGVRHLAFFILESKQAFVHEMGTAGNTVARHRAVLPSPSQKIQSYAFINTSTLQVVFHDKKREIAGENRYLIADGLLNCSTEASCKESLEKLQRIVEYVAETHGENPTVAVSKSKVFLSENAAVSPEVDVEALGHEVFAGDDTMYKRYEEALVEEALPRQVAMKQSATKRATKTHRIRTDTGIDIAFPAEYGKNPQLIEFITAPDGHISIEIKNVTHIENR